MAEEDTQENIEENIELIEVFAKKHMTKEALSRYGNLKLAHPQRALKIILQISQLAQSGAKEIDDSKLREMLKDLK